MSANSALLLQGVALPDMITHRRIKWPTNVKDYRTKGRLEGQVWKHCILLENVTAAYG